MICLECVNGLVREFPGDRREVICCLDSRLVMAVTKCNMFFRVVDDKPVVESVIPEMKFYMPEIRYEDVPRETVIGKVSEAYNMAKEQGHKLPPEPPLQKYKDLVVDKGESIIWEHKDVYKDIQKTADSYEIKRGRGRPRKT